MKATDLKRQILMESDGSGIRRRIIEDVDSGKLDSNDFIDMGQAYDALTKTKGWAYIESYILRQSNLIGQLFVEKEDPVQKGVAKGLVGLMQHVDQVIKAKDALLERINSERTAPKTES